MSLFPCSANSQVAQSWNAMLHFPSSSTKTKRRSLLDFRSSDSQLVGNGNKPAGNQWSFVGGSRVVINQEAARVVRHRKGFTLSASLYTGSQIAANAFTLGTISVLPFYALMIVAPNARVTKTVMRSSAPYIVLGILSAYLLYLSWTPETLRVLYVMPELPGITEMFSRQTTMASAWIHFMAVDLFAARQVFHDGLKNTIPTRHSIALCLLSCPLGIMSHAITKWMTKRAK